MLLWQLVRHVLHDWTRAGRVCFRDHSNINVSHDKYLLFLLLASRDFYFVSNSFFPLEYP